MAIGQKEGAVIGLKPTNGLRLNFEASHSLLPESDTNLRFQTEQESEYGFQYKILMQM